MTPGRQEWQERDAGRRLHMSEVVFRPARPAASETWGLGVVPGPGVFTQPSVEGDPWPWWWARVCPDWVTG